MIRTVEKAIRRKTRERENQEQRLSMRREKRPVWWAFAAGLIAAVVLMRLIKSFFPTLFYHLTAGL